MNKTPNPNYRYIISLYRSTCDKPLNKILFRVTIYDIGNKLQETEKIILCPYKMFLLMLCPNSSLSTICTKFNFQEYIILSKTRKFYKYDYIFDENLNETHESLAYLDNPYAVERIIRCALLFLMHKYDAPWLILWKNRRLTRRFINSISYTIKHPQ